MRHVAERLGRRTFERSPLDVNVETDLGIIWAGSPDWNAACFWVPDTGPLGAPPGTLAEWQKWVAGHGGYDSGTSTVLLTVVARSKVTVVISPPLVTATSHPLPAGRYLARPTAGAEVHPLGFDISLMDAGQSLGHLVGYRRTAVRASQLVTERRASRAVLSEGHPGEREAVAVASSTSAHC